MAKLEEIEGIGPVYAGKLRSAGITTQDDLLAKAVTKTERTALASSAEVSEKLLLNWVNRADLARVKGIGEEFADLLEHSGVDSVPELAQRNATNLHAKMTEVNASKNLVNRLPSESMVERWVEEAKALPRAVHH
ncbi:MAG: DUF4332 domain-containing protein [Fimbriimonadaceae bacterium]|nr:DUF4332 domain-containing protein [Fimbriimonadaceae bacterium]